MNIKNNFILGISLLGNLILFIGFISLYQGTSSDKQSIKPQRIAIFEPASHPAMDEIVQGFMDTLNPKGSFLFKRYNGNGNKSLMHAQAQEILDSNYDLIFTIGASASKMIKEQSSKKNSSNPVVFAAVSNPVELELVHSLASSGNQITGVSECDNYQEQIELLLSLKPEIRNILLVYDPTQASGTSEQIQKLQSVLSGKNIRIKKVEVFQAHEIQQKVKSLLDTIDVVLVLKDHTVVSGIDSLVKLCNTYNVTLYASDLNSGEKGAVLSYGVKEYDFGVEGAKKSLKILQDHKAPTDIPITTVPHHRIRINSSVIDKQNMPINDNQLKLFAAVDVK